MEVPTQQPPFFNIFEWYEQLATRSESPHPHTVGRLVHWALAAHASAAIEFKTLEKTLTPYLDRKLVLDDLTGHIGSEPISFSPEDITVKTEYGSQGLVVRRLFLPRIPSPRQPESLRQFTFRLDRNSRPTFEVYAETSF